MAQSRVPAGVPNLPGYSVTQPVRPPVQGGFCMRKKQGLMSRPPGLTAGAYRRRPTCARLFFLLIHRLMRQFTVEGCDRAASSCLPTAAARPHLPCAIAPDPPTCLCPAVQMAVGYSKKQTLQFRNGYAVPVPLDQPTAAAAAPLQQESTEIGSLPAASAPAPDEVVATFAPKYVQYDKQVRA